MLFDERPKETLQDFYDRKKELEELKRAIGKPIIVLTGMRMVGKTSMLKVFFNECTFPNALVDARSLNSDESLYTIFSDILTQLNRKSAGSILSNALKHITGVKIFGVEIWLSWKEQRADLQNIMDQVNRLGPVIIEIDEAENFRGKFAKDVTLLLAHCYDYCKNITFILTGTEVGFLLDLLSTEKFGSPLYSRYIEKVRLEPFSKSMSIEFLKKGFSQYGLNVDEDLIVYAVDRLGGVVGWLTELGSRAVNNGMLTKELIDEVAEKATRYAKTELDHLSPNYRYVVEAIASGYKSYSEIKNFFKHKTGSVVRDPQLSHYLGMLVAMDYITKDKQGKYEFSTSFIKNVFVK